MTAIKMHADAKMVSDAILGSPLCPKVVLIMRGLPGSGKSTLTQALSAHFNTLENVVCDIVSADAYFMHGNEYRFVPSDIGNAHASCFRSFHRAMLKSDGDSRHFDRDVAFGVKAHIVIVDNTNVSRAEFTPYVMLAGLHGYAARIVEVGCEVNTCVARNVHNVPETAILNMWNRAEGLLSFDPPSITVNNI